MSDWIAILGLTLMSLIIILAALAWLVWLPTVGSLYLLGYL